MTNSADKVQLVQVHLFMQKMPLKAICLSLWGKNTHITCTVRGQFSCVINNLLDNGYEIFLEAMFDNRPIDDAKEMAIALGTLLYLSPAMHGFDLYESLPIDRAYMLEKKIKTFNPSYVKYSEAPILY